MEVTARARLASLVAALAVLVALVAPSAALGATATFANSTAKATYDAQIVFSVDVATDAAPARAELRLGFPDALGPFIVDVPVRATAGTQTLTYALDLTGGGHLVPNTPISFQWALYPKAGEDPVLSATERTRYKDTTQDWQTLKGDLITVHWYAGSKAFAQKALRIGEQAVKDTSALLGVTETEPIDFFIYGDNEAFRKALGPGTRENVGGQAHSDIRTLFALIEPSAIDDPWVGIVVPHELTHLVFDTAVHNPYRFPPRWLNEGLAVYLSEGYGSGDRNMVSDAVASKDLIPLVALGAQFPTDPQKTSLAYAESVSAIDYLVRTQGQDTMIKLVLAYKDGLTDDEAFEQATGADLETFQAGWLDELGADTPEQFGPQPAPAGPLPSGWSGPAPSAGSGGNPGAATDAPGAPGATSSPGDAGSPDGGSGTATSGSVALVVGGLVLVVVVVVVGLVLARRRGGVA